MHSDSGGKEHAVALVGVDVSTGKLERIPITTNSGDTLKLSLDEVGYSVSDAHSLDNNGNFVWLGGNGVLYRTSVKTGHTSVLNDELQKDHPGGESERLYHFSSNMDTVSVLVEDTEDPLLRPRIVVFNKNTGKIEKDIAIKGLKKDIPQSIVFRDIAGKPTQ